MTANIGAACLCIFIDRKTGSFGLEHSFERFRIMALTGASVHDIAIARIFEGLQGGGNLPNTFRVAQW